MKGWAIVLAAGALSSCEKEDALSHNSSFQGLETDPTDTIAEDSVAILEGTYVGTHYYTLWSNSDIQFETSYADTILVSIVSLVPDSVMITIDGHPAEVLPGWSLSNGSGWCGWGAGDADVTDTVITIHYTWLITSFPYADEHRYVVQRL